MTIRTVQNKMIFKCAGRAVIVVTGALVCLSPLPVSAQAPATAPVLVAQQTQQQPKRRTLFDMLFGNSRKRQQEQASPPVRQQQRRNTAPVKKKPVIRKPKPVVTTPAQPPAVAKNPDARKILVIGDFIASGLAEGLNETFAQVPELQVINRTNGSSGFVRQDYYNWSTELPAILAEQKPAVLVMMIGANDRQSLTQNNSSAAPDSEEWKKLYQTRIEEFLQVTSKSGIPVIWIGQPPYQSSALTQTMLSANALYKTAAEKTAGTQPTAQTTPSQSKKLPQVTFVDIWNGFVDDSGHFTQTGVDVNGQTVRLRSSDGINMTSAGKRKLAFYAEKPLRQLLIQPPVQADTTSVTPTAESAKTKLTRIGPMKLSDLDEQEDESLLGETIPNGRTDKPYIAATPPSGRADNFQWPRP